MSYVVWLDQCPAHELRRFGGKSVALGAMARAGVPVPLGFAVATDAYGLLLARSGLEPRIRARLEGAQTHDVNALAALSAELRAWVEAADIPPEIEDAIGRSYVDLATRHGEPDVTVAVRSSAVAEDLAAASFAGQHDTFLGVRGMPSILRRLTQCWSSLFTARAIAYRLQKGLPSDTGAMGVAIQKMVNARVAGAACTLNPVNGDRSKIVIDASWGLGEAVARGEVTPDHFVVDKVVMGIVKRTVSPKPTEYVVDVARGCASQRPVPLERQRASCLSDDEVLTIARLAVRLETHAGQPQCLEWAIDVDRPSSERVVMLQSRSETAWSQRSRSPVSEVFAVGVEGVLATLLRPPGRP